MPNRVVIDRRAAQQIGEIWPERSIFDPKFHLIDEGRTLFVECRVAKMAGDCTLEFLRVSPFPPPQLADGGVIQID